jgi:uncharacterized membrane protein YdfJ with MMPL/SSD domain
MARPNLAARAAHWSSKHRKKAILGWLACVVVGLVLVTQLGIEQIPDEDLGSGGSKKAEQLLADRFPDRVGEEVLFQGRGEVTARDPRFSEAVREVDRALRRFAYVQEIESPLAPGNQSQFSKDGRSALLTFEMRGDEDQAEENVTDVLAAVGRVQAAHPELRVEEFGGASAGKALSERFEDDFQRAETLSLPITLVILLLAFGALVAALVPLMLGISAVIITLGLVALISGVLPFSESIFSVILLIGLAVGVDYSLFYIRREREERAEGRSEHGALMAAAATTAYSSGYSRTATSKACSASSRSTGSSRGCRSPCSCSCSGSRWTTTSSSSPGCVRRSTAACRPMRRSRTGSRAPPVWSLPRRW